MGDRSMGCLMDWQGQMLAEQLMQIMISSFAVMAFLGGYALDSFEIMLLVYAGVVVLTSVITVFNWPFFNSHPLNWLPQGGCEASKARVLSEHKPKC
ncbi:hypothetical protein RJ639_029628 [Escallonia herrerae]|uniref:Signal peptidase complex subunit 1 n=1 Tax=Escallonia herrerae TaxID=1293975 RepID=A0AA89BCF8_9ASTE|nr:hypothetical protein RJ639_029628 [Escallonia herrerae]